MYYTIKANKCTKYFRKHVFSSPYLLVDIIERLPFGKLKVSLFYDDRSFPYFPVNYIGNTVIDYEDIEIPDQNLYKRIPNYLMY